MKHTIGLQSVLYGMAILLLLGCSPVRLMEAEAEEGFSLSNYKTFDFYEVDTGGDELKAYASQLDFLKQEIVTQLQQRGLQQSTSSPDLKINLGVVVKEQVQTRQTNMTTDPPYYMGQRRYTWKSEEVEVRRYQLGTLS